MKRALALLFALCASPGFAEIQTKNIEYKHQGTTFEGYLAYDDAGKGSRPGVIIVHQWKGLTDYERNRAQLLAREGYVVLAVDVYGKGVRPKDTAEAGAQAGKYKKDRELLRARVKAGLDTLLKQPGVDPKKVAAIGYCFGGTAVIELARSGADVAAVVSFHGGLDSPQPQAGKQIKAKVLALHGADDPFVPEKELKAFEEEMRTGNVDWQLIKYGGAVHSFTEKQAGSDNSKGAAYNEAADRRSWANMLQLFKEVF